MKRKRICMKIVVLVMFSLIMNRKITASIYSYTEENSSSLTHSNEEGVIDTWSLCKEDSTEEIEEITRNFCKVNKTYIENETRLTLMSEKSITYFILQGIDSDCPLLINSEDNPEYSTSIPTELDTPLMITLNIPNSEDRTENN